MLENFSLSKLRRRCVFSNFSFSGRSLKELVTFSYSLFLRRHPALHYAIFIWLGIEAGLYWRWGLIAPIICPFLILTLAPLSKQRAACGRVALAYLLMTSAWLSATTLFTLPSLPVEGKRGIALFKPESLARMSGRFGSGWTLRGSLLSFSNEVDSERVAKRAPCSITFPGKEPPPVDHEIVVKGTLHERSRGSYYLKTAKHSRWQKGNSFFSLAEWRFYTKETIIRFIKERISNNRSAAFLGGIATGSFNDALMKVQLGRFGLQHIMAISGFHFAIVAAMLSQILRMVLPRRTSCIILMLLVTLYFQLLGPSASIMRAWSMIFLTLAAVLIERSSSGLNTLGAAIIFITLFDPLMTQTIGFQFSVAITASILMFYPLANRAIASIIKKRKLSEMVEMDIWSQHAYCLLAAFRSSLALTVAVQLTAIPLTLYFFGKFPLMSLPYNLFFPFLVSVAMLLLFVSLPLALILPPLGNIMLALTGHYTAFVLNYAYNMPPMFDIFLSTRSLTSDLLLLYFPLLALLGIVAHGWMALQRDEEQSLSFV